MNRFRFIVGRLLQTIPVVLLVLLMVFSLLHLAPGDPARAFAGLRASEASVQHIRHEFGLDRPLIIQYGTYVKNAVQGNLGTSTVSQEPVLSIIRQRAPVTLWLIFCGALLSTLFSLGLATVSARRRGGIVDGAVRFVTTVGIGMPVFWVGLMLILLVALPTGWFPVGGFGMGFVGHLQAILLPAVTLGFALAPLQTRALRSSLIQVYDSDYAATARSLGVSEVRLWWRHLLRNAAPPAITVLAVQMGSLLFGAVIVENTFGLPGLGEGLVQAVSRRDFPMVQGIALMSALLVLVAHLTADILYAVLDPRVEMR